MYKVNIPAIHKAAFPIEIIGIIVIPLSLKIKKANAINCIAVFAFEILETGTLTFIFARYSLKPDTAISLSSIINAGIVSQSAITSFDVKISITAATSNLSAIGSRKVPKLVTSSLKRAI